MVVLLVLKLSLKTCDKDIKIDWTNLLISWPVTTLPVKLRQTELTPLLALVDVAAVAPLVEILDRQQRVKEDVEKCEANGWTEPGQAQS